MNEPDLGKPQKNIYFSGPELSGQFFLEFQQKFFFLSSQALTGYPPPTLSGRAT